MRRRRPIREAIVTVGAIAALVASAVLVSDNPVDSPLPTAPKAAKGATTEQVVVDGKVWTKHSGAKARISAKDFMLAHDGVARHAQGIATSPPTAFDPPDASYPMQDWWMEGVPYILHRKTTSGNPPVSLNYYRGGFDMFSWRGDYDTIFGDEETVALNSWDISVALVKHPVGGTLTTNLVAPLRSPAANPGSYTCQSITPEVMVPWSANTIIRTNLVVRPRWMYWSSTNAAFSVVPHGQVRRMTHSFGLLADGEDSTTVAAYTNSWSDYVASPGNSSAGQRCAPEVIQEP